jgi:rSAM/selenodomain-associated transferase 1
MNGADGALQIFAKAPVPGCVKTRLIPTIGAEAAAALYRDLLARTANVAARSGMAAIELWVDDPNDPYFRAMQRSRGWTLRSQSGPDLGTRMLRAFERALRVRQFAVLIGSDCPSLEPRHIDRARRALCAGIDAVLAPAQDGGYVLLGLRRVRRELFEALPWGRWDVVSLTRARFAALRLRWVELEPLWDVDRPGDLKRLNLRRT